MKVLYRRRLLPALAGGGVRLGDTGASHRVNRCVAQDQNGGQQLVPRRSIRDRRADIA